MLKTKDKLKGKFLKKWCGEESESHWAVSDSSRSHGLYKPWKSPDQNTGVGSHSLLQGIFPTQGWNPGLPQDSLASKPPDGKGNNSNDYFSSEAMEARRQQNSIFRVFKFFKNANWDFYIQKLLSKNETNIQTMSKKATHICHQKICVTWDAKWCSSFFKLKRNYTRWKASSLPPIVSKVANKWIQKLKTGCFPQVMSLKDNWSFRTKI